MFRHSLLSVCWNFITRSLYRLEIAGILEVLSIMLGVPKKNDPSQNWSVLYFFHQRARVTKSLIAYID